MTIYSEHFVQYVDILTCIPFHGVSAIYALFLEKEEISILNSPDHKI